MGAQQECKRFAAYANPRRYMEALWELVSKPAVSAAADPRRHMEEVWDLVGKPLKLPAQVGAKGKRQ